MSCGVHEIPEHWTSCPFCERVQERVFVEQVVSRWERTPKPWLVERAYVLGEEEACAEIRERDFARRHETEDARYALNYGRFTGRLFKHRCSDERNATMRKWTKFAAWNSWFAAGEDL